jgi:tetratricopeptide (TPR) repeat protein
MLYVVLGGMGVALLGLGGYVYISQQKPPASLPPAPTTLAAAPPTTAPPPPTTVAAGPPPTAAPPPTFGEAKGRGAMAIKGAQSAFASGNYDRAIAEAQSALREDPGNVQAQRILDQALSGQKAETRFRAAESALAQKDYASAMNEAEAGRAAAPWDSRGPSLISRIREAQQRAEQQAQQAKAAQAAAQVNGLLSQADTALQQQKYDAAIALYDEVLKVDPTNQRATLGKTGAVSARALAQAAASGGGLRPGGGRSFVSGKTQAQSLETRTGGAVPEGFEDTAGVTVKKGTQASELPGKISFDIEPEFVKPGDKYTVKIFLLNEGNAPIQIQNMIVTTTVNGRKTSGPVPPVTKDVAPQQKAVLLSLPDFWKEDTTAWSMEVTVRTARGETYKNQVTWK